MFKTLRNAWAVVDLRRKILYTLLIILIFRIGAAIPVPFLDASVLANTLTEEGGYLSLLNTLSGGALSKGTLFALSIQPYINASIIVQLLTYALPPLERLQKEGQEGRKKIQKITSVVSMVIALIMAYAYYMLQRNQGAIHQYNGGFANVFVAVVIIVAFVAGSSLIVWLGNQVNEKGIGNGISIILFAGIVARIPIQVITMFKNVSNNLPMIFVVILILLIFVAMIGFIVFMNESERRIPIQYAKRVVGRKQYGGQSTHIPIKVAMSGVMPIIFAMSILSIPQMLTLFIKPDPTSEKFWDKFYVGFQSLFSTNTAWYAIIYFLLIIAFNYFYVSMQYNPIEIANNLRQNNGGIPGIRPGKPTSDFIQRVLSKITLVGAVFLGIIAVIPIFANMMLPEGFELSMAGTSILIIVSVVLETTRTLESQMMMRHHKGFLE